MIGAFAVHSAVASIEGAAVETGNKFQQDRVLRNFHWIVARCCFLRHCVHLFGDTRCAPQQLRVWRTKLAVCFLGWLAATPLVLFYGYLSVLTYLTNRNCSWLADLLAALIWFWINGPPY
jgi:hypothetical protein